MKTCSRAKGPGGRPVQHPGLRADARALGYSVHHLRLVLIRERISPTVSARYRQLKGEKLTKADAQRIAEFNRRQAMKKPLPDITPDASVFADYNREALENFSPNVFAQHTALGWATVAVVLRWCVEPVLDYPGLFAELNAQLTAAKAGHFEKEFLLAGRQYDLVNLPRDWRGQWADIGAVVTGRFVNFPGQVWGVFHIPRAQLANGLNILQAALAPRAPQLFSNILYAQTLRTFREHWPESGRSVCLDR